MGQTRHRAQNRSAAALPLALPIPPTCAKHRIHNRGSPQITLSTPTLNQASPVGARVAPSATGSRSHSHAVERPSTDQRDGATVAVRTGTRAACTAPLSFPYRPHHSSSGHAPTALDLGAAVESRWPGRWPQTGSVPRNRQAGVPIVTRTAHPTPNDQISLPWMVKLSDDQNPVPTNVGIVTVARYDADASYDHGHRVC